VANGGNQQCKNQRVHRDYQLRNDEASISYPWHDYHQMTFPRSCLGSAGNAGVDDQEEERQLRLVRPAVTLCKTVPLAGQQCIGFAMYHGRPRQSHDASPAMSPHR